jgi:hypothetical protein
VGEHTRLSLDADKFHETLIRSDLHRLVDARLLVSQQLLIARRLAHKSDDAPPAQIASVCIPASNRPAMLRRIR